MLSTPEIIGGPTEVKSDESDRRAFSYRVRQGDVVHNVLVMIPTALMATPPTTTLLTLHSHVALIVATKGRSALEHSLAKGRIPKRLTFGYMERDFGDDPD